MLKKALPTALALLSGLGIGIGVQQDQHPEYKQLHIEYWNPEAKELSDRKVKTCRSIVIASSGTLVQDGPYTHWYASGQKEAEGTYKADKLNGPYASYHSNGRQKDQLTFKDGKLEGLHIQWYASGQKAMEVSYANGKIDGRFQRWHSNGKPHIEFSALKGLPDGPCICWHENGQKSYECTYKNGHGLAAYYYSNGQKAMEMRYDQENPGGVRVGHWDKTGKKFGSLFDWNSTDAIYHEVKDFGPRQYLHPD